MTNTTVKDNKIQAPAWLNEEFLKLVLKGNEGNAVVKIENCVITSGTSKADHYGSIMYRAKVNYAVNEDSKEKHKVQSLIIKTEIIAEGKQKDLVDEMSTFETEIKMYTEAIPTMESILRKYKDQTKLGPRFLYHSASTPKCIVLEDLIEEGYTANTGRHLTLEEVKFRMLKLAKMHAVSFKLGKENNNVVTSLNQGSFTANMAEKSPLVKNAINDFKDILKAHNDLSLYIPLIERVEKGLIQKCVDFYEAYSNGKRDGILVLNHGDFHLRNVMFKNNGSQLTDLMLIDFQLSFFGSAAIDLIYGYMLLFNAEMRRNHREELFNYYIEQFQATLQQIEYKGSIPTVMDFQKELEKHKHLELFFLISFFLFNYIFSDPEGNLGKAVEDEIYRKSILGSKPIIEELRVILARYRQMGFFDE